MYHDKSATGHPEDYALLYKSYDSIYSAIRISLNLNLTNSETVEKLNNKTNKTKIILNYPN